jgi:ribosomal protein S18 acetylase RimI-like enzyme
MTRFMTSADPIIDLLYRIELATFDAVPPLALEQVGPWWVGLDPGTVSRAHSAVPVSIGPELIASVASVIARYRAAGLQPCLRLPDRPALEGLRQHLQSLGYRASPATWVQRASCSVVLERLKRLDPQDTDPRPLAQCELRIEAFADDAWCALFLGEGFDPVDGASRTAILRRARHARYASIREGDQVVAVGMGSFSQGWASIHGMRVHPAWRSRGLGRSLIGALLHCAQEQALQRVFLQVEVSNVRAHDLYGRIGFDNLWTYRYWRPEGAA